MGCGSSKDSINEGAIVQKNQIGSDSHNSKLKSNKDGTIEFEDIEYGMEANTPNLDPDSKADGYPNGKSAFGDTRGHKIIKNKGKNRKKNVKKK